MTTHKNGLKNGVDHLSSVRGMLTVRVSKARRKLTGARAEIGFLTGKVTTHKRSAEEAKWRASHVQYELDGAHARVFQLTSPETRRQEQVDRIAR